MLKPFKVICRPDQCELGIEPVNNGQNCRTQPERAIRQVNALHLYVTKQEAWELMNKIHCSGFNKGHNPREK